MQNTLKIPARILMIEASISKASGVSVPDMRGHRRDKTYADARHAVWYVANVHLNYSLMELGRCYDRDHTTIMSGVRKMRDNKFGERVVESLKKNCPIAFEGASEGKMLEKWDL
jgi:chromosomal replication initiation ATPase DnaA